MSSKIGDSNRSRGHSGSSLPEAKPATPTFENVRELFKKMAEEAESKKHLEHLVEGVDLEAATSSSPTPIKRRGSVKTIKKIDQAHAPVMRELGERLSSLSPPPSRKKEESLEEEFLSEGKVFEAEFKDLADRSIAVEKAIRAETVTMLIKGLETKKAKLEKAGVSITEVEELLTKYGKYLDETITHATTNTARQAFEELGVDLAKEELVPILSNLRIQTVQDSSGNIVSSITRSGAISDFSHGEVSLQELKDFMDLTAEGVPKTLERLTKMYDLAEHDVQVVAAEIKLKILSSYGESVVDGSIPEKLSKLIKSKKLLENIKISPEKLEVIISKRREHLELLVLQDLELHLRTLPATKDVILYGRTSLVDLKKDPVKEKSGCVLDERTQGLDMRAIFDEFEGKRIVFDGEDTDGSYIDPEGTIHMPKTCANGITESKLQTAFFNVCVQGPKDHVINKGLQQVINEEMLEKFSSYKHTEEYKKLADSLKTLSEKGTHDPNDTVLLITQFIQSIGGYTGINCFGGKDRTGYAVALVTFEHLNRLADKPSKELLKQWGASLLSKNGVATLIAKDNADQEALKLSRPDLSLYRLAGNLKRVKHLFKIVIGEVEKMASGQSYTTSKTAGQLDYKRSDSPNKRSDSPKK